MFLIHKADNLTAGPCLEVVIADKDGGIDSYDLDEEKWDRIKKGWHKDRHMLYEAPRDSFAQRTVVAKN